MTEIYRMYAILLLISTITILYLSFYSWDNFKKYDLTDFSFNFSVQSHPLLDYSLDC